MRAAGDRVTQDWLGCCREHATRDLGKIRDNSDKRTKTIPPGSISRSCCFNHSITLPVTGVISCVSVAFRASRIQSACPSDICHGTQLILLHLFADAAIRGVPNGLCRADVWFSPSKQAAETPSSNRLPARDTIFSDTYRRTPPAEGEWGVSNAENSAQDIQEQDIQETKARGDGPRRRQAGETWSETPWQQPGRFRRQQRNCAHAHGG